MFKRLSLGRKERLTDQIEFKRVLFQGKRVVCNGFEIRMLKNTVGLRRLGITLSRKAGPAIVRNSVKRKVREWFRNNKPFLKESTDFIFLFKEKLDLKQIKSMGLHIGEYLIETK